MEFGANIKAPIDNLSTQKESSQTDKEPEGKN